MECGEITTSILGPAFGIILGTGTTYMTQKRDSSTVHKILLSHTGKEISVGLLRY